MTNTDLFFFIWVPSHEIFFWDFFENSWTLSLPSLVHCFSNFLCNFVAHQHLPGAGTGTETGACAGAWAGAGERAEAGAEAGAGTGAGVGTRARG